MDCRFLDKNHSNERYKCDGVKTHTFNEQKAVEDSVESCFQFCKNLLDVEDGRCLELHRKKHRDFLLKGIQFLSQSYECLDASRPWLCYWIVHSMRLLHIPISDELADRIATFLDKCQSPKGGFAGGPMQFPHLAPTYAAVNALVELGTTHAFKVINRPKLQDFLRSRRNADGAFTMHEGGEVDIRGAYCAISAARLSNVATSDMFDGTAEWIIGCQTYEGGFAGCHGAEAHGGYSFCGLAALVLLGKEKLCDLKALLRWTAARQMSYEGGFQGRTNKLVDGCYSFWQGGAFPVLHMALMKDGEESLSESGWMFHQGALQEYVLLCCQYPAGGLIDKPGKPRDFYHTCYCLSGLSTAQHFAGDGKVEPRVLGLKENELRPTHPVYNIEVECMAAAAQYFNSLPVPNVEEDHKPLVEELD